MKKNYKIKSKLAGLLAAVMVCTMAAPGIPAYASTDQIPKSVPVPEGGVAKLKFDPANGPSLKEYSNYASVGTEEDGVLVVTGSAGTPLSDATLDAFPGVGLTDGSGSGPRPVMPAFNVTWPGYTFDSWEDESGNEVTRLPYAFPYMDTTTYKAVWNGDTSDTAPKYNFTVRHYRDRNPERGESDDNADAWPALGAEDTWEFFHVKSEDGGEDNWVKKGILPNTPVSSSYKRNIPGYRFKSVLIRNNMVRSYANIVDGTAGTLPGGADINPSTNSVRGNMPNDHLEVAYRYEPDPSKKFPLTIRHILKTNNKNGTVTEVEVKPTEKYSLNAEAEIDIISPEINAYVRVDGTVTKGDTGDLPGSGTYPIVAANVELDIGQSDPDQSGSGRVTGEMPNQPVEVTYVYERDTSYKTILNLVHVDNHGNSMGELAPDKMEVEIEPFAENGDPNNLQIELTEVPGYIYPPHLTWDGDLTTAGIVNNATTGEPELTIQSGLEGGTLTFTYNENLNDKDHWAKVEYYSGPGGTITGDVGHRFLKIREEPYFVLGQAGQPGLVSPGITLNEEPHYEFAGWYLANSSGTGWEGSRLDDPDVVNPTFKVERSMKLYANFKEKEDEWFDLTFSAGENGSIVGNPSIHTTTGTVWNTLPIPVEHADPGYTFKGWYDQNDNQVQATQTIESDQHYTAKFVPIVVEDNLLAMPDARGIIASNGSGTVTVEGANAARKYALTDMEGKIIGGTKTGIQLSSGGFTELYPGTAYQVFELLENAHINGSMLPEGTDPTNIGPPAVVRIPALGGNYTYSADGGAGGTMQFEVNPAAPGTDYAILNTDGEVVSESDQGGWVSSGSTLRVLFTGLEPNQIYVVVARSSENESAVTPADKQSLGTQVSVNGTAQQESEYTIALTNGGYIESITRGGASVPLTEEKPIEAIVREGDKIKINADLENGTRIFEEWKILIGSSLILYPDQRTQNITMTDENVMLQATYETEPPSGGTGTATLDFTPKDGKTAMDLSDPELLTGLTDNTTDEGELGAGRDVDYMVKFDRSIPTASEANALLDETGDESVKAPWVLASSLARKVQGINKELVSGNNNTPDIKIFTVIDKSLLEYMDFKLWELETIDDEVVLTPVSSMSPDPNDSESGFTGSISFDGKVGSKYLLSYSKAHEITICDQYGVTGSTQHVIKVKSGTALEGTEAYELLNFGDYQDPLTNIVYEFKGLGKTAASSEIYDTASPVTKSMTLHVVYEQEDDTEWKAARKKLIDEIAIANALMNHASTSEEEKQVLEDAIAAASEVANRTARATIEELISAYDTLKAVMDSISGGGDDPGDPDNPEDPDDPDNPGDPGDPGDPDDPDDPDNPGGSGGGGGGGGGGRVGGSGPSQTFNRYKTYNGDIDGDWMQTAEDGGRWSYVLKSGTRISNQWVNIKYPGDSQTYTYHFNINGTMDVGWYADEQGSWYWLSTAQGSDYGRLLLGWQFDSVNGNWYYLNTFTGSMLTGWQQLGKDWYYLNTSNETGRPVGAMYRSEITPDGYHVDENGKWIRVTP